MGGKQARFYSLEIMGHVTQEGWASGGQARKSKMKIQASSGKYIQNDPELGARPRDERGTKRGRLPYFQAQPSSPKSQFSMGKTQSNKLL